MTHTLRPHPNYKPSGIEWIGDVPTHWEVKKLRHVLTSFTERNRLDLPLLSVVREQGIIKRNIEDTDTNHNFIPDDLSNYKVVHHGQFAMNKMKAWQGSYGVSAYDGIISPAYFVFDIAGVRGDYFHAAIRSLAYVPFFARASDGVRIGQWDLSQEHMREIPFVIPPPPDQRAIVRFLDHADHRIQRFVNAKERLIALLEEERRAVVNRAVTRGLDASVRMKPSGVEWLGDVPDHWEVAAVKQVYDITLGKMLQNTPSSPDDIPVPYLKALNVQWFKVKDEGSRTMWASPREVKAYGVRRGDLLVCEGGEGGRCAIFKGDEPGYIIQNALHRVRHTSRSSNEFLQYVMFAISTTGWFDSTNDKATIAHFTKEKFGRLRIPLPPSPEQRAIVYFLDRATTDIDARISRARRQIELMREYRARLIADAVTGKIDVREAGTALDDVGESVP